MAVNYQSIGANIKRLRKKRGLSQEALSEMVACSPTYISHIERGTRTMSVETFVRSANALQVSADELLVDSLENTAVTFNHVFADVIEDCSEYEKHVLLHIVAEAKTALRKNAAYLRL